MKPLEELLLYYKALLNTDFSDMEPEQGESEIFVREIPRVEERGAESVSEVSVGDILEIVPSYDNLEMVFLLLREERGFYEIIPLTRFWEFATPSDVLIEVRGERYIAQTDLSLLVPKHNFSKRFGNAHLFKIDRVDRETLERIIRVAEGQEKGDGGMSGGVKGEFKELESRRWLALFTSQIAEEEAIQELSYILETLKEEELSLAASEQEQTWGEKEGLKWFYDSEEETLIIAPARELVGKEKRILLDLEGEELILFEGQLPEKMEIPLKGEAYSHRVLERRLKLEDV